MAITSQILVSDKKSVHFGQLRFFSTHSKYKKPHWGPLTAPPSTLPHGVDDQNFVWPVCDSLRALELNVDQFLQVNEDLNA